MPYIKDNKLYVEDDNTSNGTVVSGSLSYNTGWISRSSWANVHMGSSTTKNLDSNLVHNLDANLYELMVLIFVSTDGTNANTIQVYESAHNHDGDLNTGITIYQVSTNAIKIQTGADGAFSYLNDSGVRGTLDTEDWYYRVVVYKIG